MIVVTVDPKDTERLLARLQLSVERRMAEGFKPSRGWCAAEVAERADDIALQARRQRVVVPFQRAAR